MDMEKANDKLAAQMGATGQYAADLGKIAGDVYAGAYGDSLGQVNEALRGVLQSGAVMEDASDEQIQHITEGVLNLASAFDVDLGSATTAVGQMMRTGMASNAQEALDIITRGMQEGGDASGDLLDTFTEYPALFQRLGIGGADAMGLINQGMSAGARNSDLVADALKEFQIRATDGSKTSADAFKLMGLNAADMTAQIAAGGPGAAAGLDTVLDRLRNMEDPVARNAAAVGIFGTQAEDLGAALFALDPTDAVADMGKVAGAADQMGDALNDNAATKVEEFKRGAMQALVTFLADYVLPAFDRIRGVVQSVVDGFSGANGAVTSALGPIGETLSGFGNALREIWNAIGGDILGGWRGTWNAIKTIFGGVLSVLRGVLDVFVGVFTGDWSRMWQGVKGIFSGVWNIIVGILKWAWSAIKAAVSVGAKAIGGLLSAAWEAIKGAARAAWDWVAGKVSGAWTSIKNAVSSGIGAVVGFVSSLPGRVLSALGNFGSLLYSAGGDLLRGLWNGISGAAGWLWGKVRGWASSLWDNIKGFFEFGSPSRLTERAGGWLMQGMARGIAGNAGTAVNAALGAAGKIGGALQVAPATAGIGVNGGAGGRFGATPGVRVYIGDRELTDIVRVETGAHVDRQLGGVADALHYAGA